MSFLPWVPTAGSLTLPVPVVDGGTGQTTANAGFDALSPLTTAGDLIIEDGTPTAARLAVGSSSQVLGVSGGLPAWVAKPTGTVTSVTAGDTSIVVGGTGAAPTIATGTLDVIAADHPPVAAVAMNGQKITGLANGTVSTDSAAFGQVPVVDTTAADIQQIGTASVAGANGKWADSGHVHPSPLPLPADFAQIAWSNDPAAASVGTALTNNTITLVAVFLRKVSTITNIVINISTAGTSLTSGQNFGGIYDSTGTRQGVTADQTTPWASTGTKTMALTSAFTNAPAGMYYVALLSNGSGTVPSVRCSNNIASLANAGVPTASLRYATNGTGTTLPSSLTLASNSITNVTPFTVILT